MWQSKTFQNAIIFRQGPRGNVLEWKIFSHNAALLLCYCNWWIMVFQDTLHQMELCGIQCRSNTGMHLLHILCICSLLCTCFQEYWKAALEFQVSLLLLTVIKYCFFKWNGVKLIPNRNCQLWHWLNATVCQSVSVCVGLKLYNVVQYIVDIATAGNRLNICLFSEMPAALSVQQSHRQKWCQWKCK